MGSVHLAQLTGPLGLSQLVAIKALHPQFAEDPHFVAMLRDEAKLACSLRHPNVVGIRDIIVEKGCLYLVLDYVEGESLRNLSDLQNGECPAEIAISVAQDILLGLHSAHTARNPDGSPLCIVHRDVSPQNILVDIHGIARITDFGIAKASSRAQCTRDGQLKGKLGYMSPEQLRGDTIDSRSDIYSLSIVLWELLAGRRMFDPEKRLGQLQCKGNETAQIFDFEITDELSAILKQGLEADPEKRFSSAMQMAEALSSLKLSASRQGVAHWVSAAVSDRLLDRNQCVASLQFDKSHGADTPVPRAPAGFLTNPDEITQEELQPKAIARHRRMHPVPIALVSLILGAVLSVVFWRFSSNAKAVVVKLPAPSSLAPQAQASVLPSDHQDTVPTSSGSSLAPPKARLKPPAPPSACSPPYRLDADGVKIFKPECL